MTTEMTRPTTDTVRYTVIDSTLGPILLTSDGEHLTGLYLDDFDTVLERLEAKVGVAPVLDDDLTLFATADKQLGSTSPAPAPTSTFPWHRRVPSSNARSGKH